MVQAYLMVVRCRGLIIGDANRTKGALGAEAGGNKKPNVSKRTRSVSFYNHLTTVWINPFDSHSSRLLEG